MKRQLITIIAVFLISFGESEGQVLPFTHYTTEREVNALPSAEVHKVYQDRLGYMWFAIYSSGLVRYDGVSLELFGISEGLRDVTVWDLLEDPSGRLWVSSNAGLAVTEEPLDSYSIEKPIKFISGTSQVPLLNLSVAINRMAVDREGWLWVGTENIGIIKYRFDNNGTLEADTLSTDLTGLGNNVAVRSLTARRDSSVWVSILDGTLIRFGRKGSIESFKTGREQNTNALYESPEGTLWGGDQDGVVWRLVEKNNTLHFQEISNSLKSNIANINSDSDGDIWISSEGSGLQKISVRGPNNESFKITDYTRANGLLSETVYNIYEDREQNIWIAQSGGVSKLRYNYKAFENLTSTSLDGSRPKLPSPSINTVLPSRSDKKSNPCMILAGSTEGGVACINSDYESVFIQAKDGLAGNFVNGLSYDSYGRLWIGTLRGINSLTFDQTPVVGGFEDTNTITLFGKKAFLSTYHASSILAMQNLDIPTGSTSPATIESIWFPAYHHVYVLIQNTLYTLDDTWGLPKSIFHAAAIDGEGFLWIGTRDQGIYKSRVPLNAEMLQNSDRIKDLGTFFSQTWSTDNGAPTNQIDNLLWANNKMWVGTTTGLLAIDSKHNEIIHDIDKSDGLLANNATSVAISPVSDMLWIGTNSGLAKIDPESGNVLQTVTKADGLVDNEVWYYGSVQVDGKGIVHFGTSKGVSIYYPSQDRDNISAPIVRLTNAIAEEVPGERNEFSFEYAALSFGSERLIRYQTRLVGFNDEWSDEKTSTRVNFTNLPAYLFPKTYTLEVRAVNESGVWSAASLSHNFTVTPPWWLSWGASLGYLVILGMGVFAVDRFQRKRLFKKEREAALLRETELKAETAIARSKAAEAQAKALEAENELKATELEKARELEKAYHELKNTQNRLIQAEKMASLGRLSTGIAHEIKNPLNFINNFAELSKELVDELRLAIKNKDTSEIEFITENLSLNTGKIEEHGKRADAIVKSMMQHSQNSNMNFELTDLNDIVKKYADLAYHGKSVKIPELNISIITLLDDQLPRIMTIQRQIGQVLQNIVENAFDAVWEQQLKMNGSFKPEITISTSYDSSDKIEITVSDNGAGIPEQIRERIFEPFFTTKPTGEGTGLGLSISYDIITQVHNGSLKVESNYGTGTRFIIILPVTETT